MGRPASGRDQLGRGTQGQARPLPVEPGAGLLVAHPSQNKKEPVGRGCGGDRASVRAAVCHIYITFFVCRARLEYKRRGCPGPGCMCLQLLGCPVTCVAAGGGTAQGPGRGPAAGGARTSRARARRGSRGSRASRARRSLRRSRARRAPGARGGGGAGAGVELRDVEPSNNLSRLLLCYTRPPCAPCRPVWHEELSALQTPPPSACRQSSSAAGGGAAVPWLGPSR